MPFYEYECQSCKFYTEVMQKISEPPLVKCPSCGKRTLKKLMSAPVFRLKGSGWYETDFKSDKEGKRNLADREEPRPAEESKTDKSEKSEKSDKSDAKSAAPEAAPKPSESKAASVTTGGKASAGSAARKRPAASKGGARTGSARPKAKSSGRARAAKRGSRR